jgi:ribosomal protein S18 acetylase RimI-like enzyme
MMAMATAVEAVDAGLVLELRRRVLRSGTPSRDPRFPEDADPATFHLAARDATGAVVATATFTPKPTRVRPGARAAQLRGMAVDAAAQRRGLGTALMVAGVERLRADGFTVVWANARDSALGFYERLGMSVVGDGFVAVESALPHHVVVMDL